MNRNTTRRRRASLLMATTTIVLGLAGCSGADTAEAETETSSSTSDSPIYATEESSEPGFTTAQQEAIDYVETMSRQNYSSEAEIRKHIVHENFADEVDFALEHSEVSFYTNASRAAESYADGSSPSREAVTRYLTDVREFTQEQAKDAAESYAPES